MKTDVFTKGNISVFTFGIDEPINILDKVIDCAFLKRYGTLTSADERGLALEFRSRLLSSVSYQVLNLFPNGV